MKKGPQLVIFYIIANVLNGRLSAHGMRKTAWMGQFLKRLFSESGTSKIQLIHPYGAGMEASADLLCEYTNASRTSETRLWLPPKIDDSETCHKHIASFTQKLHEFVENPHAPEVLLVLTEKPIATILPSLFPETNKADITALWAQGLEPGDAIAFGSDHSAKIIRNNVIIPLFEDYVYIGGQ